MKTILISLLLLTHNYAFAISQTNTGDKVLVGSRAVTDKTVEFNVGSGVANPKIKINSSTTKLQFSNDGTTFTDLGSSVPGMGNIDNVGITATVASSALTIAVKQSDASTNCSAASPCMISMRSSTITSGAFNKRSITSALSLVVSSGSTLGNYNATAPTVINTYVYLIDNAGALELAVSSNLIDEGNLITTVAEGGAGAADSYEVVYSTTARSNVPIKLIGKIVSSQVTAGTWATAPSRISLVPFTSTGVVTSDSATDATYQNYRIQSALIASGCASVTTQYGNWITAASSGGTGQCSVTIRTGIFSATPQCYVMAAASGAAAGEVAVAYVNVSATNFQWFQSQPGVGAVNRQTSIICFGPRS